MSSKFELLHEIVGLRKVPLLTLQREGLPNSAPRVIILHGLRGHKEKYLEELYELADLGYRATAVDLFLHGERDNSGSLSDRLDVDFANTVFQIVYETAADISSVLDIWDSEPVQVGLMAISAGGLAAHAINVSDPRITVHVSIISSPDWTTADPNHRLDPESPEYKRLEDISPSSSPEKYITTALLMLVAADDDVVSPEGSHLLFSRLQSLYLGLGAVDKLRLVVFEETGHEYTHAMRGLAMDWFAGHLTAVDREGL